MALDRVTSHDGTRIYFRTVGSGRPVLIVPGTLAPPTAYEPLVQQLADSHRVVVMSRRGYGVSEAGPRPFRMDQHAQDVSAVLTALGDRAVVFGHSTGAIATLNAMRISAGRVARLVLYEPPVALLGNALRPLLVECTRLLKAARPGDAIKAASTLCAVRSIDYSSMNLSPLAAGLRADLECVVGMALMPGQWSDVTTPTWLIEGEVSGPEFADSVRTMRALLPHARNVRLPGQAHYPHDLTPIAELISQYPETG
jgi:pimeloyl-ACP methyl ester carboxylesterase